MSGHMRKSDRSAAIVNIELDEKSAKEAAVDGRTRDDYAWYPRVENKGFWSCSPLRPDREAQLLIAQVWIIHRGVGRPEARPTGKRSR